MHKKTDIEQPIKCPLSLIGQANGEMGGARESAEVRGPEGDLHCTHKCTLMVLQSVKRLCAPARVTATLYCFTRHY